MPNLKFESVMPVPAEELFSWHARPGAFQRLVPPWDRVEIVEQKGSIRDGDVLTMNVYQGPIPMRWVAEHYDYEEGRQFKDTQTKGPFASWNHTHLFLPQENEQSTLLDDIDYALPIEPISTLVAGSFTRSKLNSMFKFRHARTLNDLTRHTRASLDPLKIAITGASGLIGSELQAFLTTGGHTVHTVTRSPKGKHNAIGWDIHAKSIDASALEGIDVVIHLAGESINQRWNDEAKQRILQSRVQGTQLLADTLASLKSPPKLLISGSAIGFYGHRPEEAVHEGSDAGDGFLAEVCRAWENATQSAQDAGIRTVHLRTGVVLTPKGGALSSMLPAFQAGTGGPVGSGKQWMSWICIDDMIGAIHAIIADESIQGPVNATAPNPVRQRDFADTLGRVLSRPSFLPLPAPAVRTIFGEMGEELLLEGAQVLPKRLQASGFEFFYPQLEDALRFILGRQK